jgi:hypothetical protein
VTTPGGNDQKATFVTETENALVSEQELLVSDRILIPTGEKNGLWTIYQTLLWDENVDRAWPKSRDQFYHRARTIDDAAMRAVIDRELERARLDGSQWTLCGVLHWNVKTHSHSPLAKYTNLETEKEGLQVIEPEGTTDRYCLSCVSSPKKSSRIIAEEPQDLRKVKGSTP